MKVTVLLRNDHEAVRSLFSRFKKAGGRTHNGGKKEIFEEIRRELLMHSQIETEIFYPALAATSSERAEEIVSIAMQEHGKVEKLLHEIGQMSPSDKQFEPKVLHLIDEVNRHIETEEEEIFDEARKNLPEYRLEELGLEMEDRRKMLTQLAA